MSTPRFALGALALVLPASAFAQDSNPSDKQTTTSVSLIQDLEDQPPEEVTSKKDLTVRMRFESEWHEFDNLDFRELDETSDQAILDSDDRGSFAFTGISARLGYRIDKTLKFNLGAAHRGLWGNDQIGNTNVFGGWVYFTALNVEWTPFDRLKLVVGRQFFSIGGENGGREYILADIVDQVRADVDLGIGTLTLIPINVMAMSGDNDDATFVSYIAQSNTQVLGFRGDTMTRRHGGILALDKLNDNLDARIYGFYTDIGALGSGSDITYDGRLGNFSDSDWVANFGLRASYGLGPIKPWAEAHASTGIDRKEEVAFDVNCDGFAFGGGLAVRTGDADSGLRANLSYFNAMGGAYAENGLMYSHGYVGLKGQHTGGTLLNRFLGWHPTAYVDMFGTYDMPHDPARKAGTQVIHANVGYQLPKGIFVRGAWWMLHDTSFTLLDFARLDNLDAPFGYSREEFAAEERLGQSLGQEVNLDVRWQAQKHISLYANGAVFLPGDFYAIEIARVAGDQLGGQAMSWGVSGGTRVQF